MILQTIVNQAALVEDAFSKRSLEKQQKTAKIKGLRRYGFTNLNSKSRVKHDFS
jgi:hypothetical protein